MRKVIFIAMAALALLTAQCKKNEPKPEEKVMVPITGSVDFGGSKTEITTAGYITPVSGDKIYIYYEGEYAGYMTCTAQPGQQFTCSGEIEDDCLGETCTFMYLGSNNGINGKTSSTISFADQTGVSVSNGKISGLEKFHVGSCQARVSSEGTVTLPMATKMAIAYFKLKDEGGNAIAAGQEVTISGVSATATINKTDGTINKTDGTGSITVHTDDEGCFYMALVPQSGEVTFSFAVDGKAGSNVFPYGIRECSFYSEQGSGSPLRVTVTPTPKFTVNKTSGTTVTFAPGNLYYDESESKWKFESNQWDFRTYNDGTKEGGSCIDGVYNASSGTPSGDWGMFGWCGSNQTHYGMSTSQVGTAYSGETLKDWGDITDLPDNADGKTWHTLSIDEWKNLLGTTDAVSPRDNAASLRAWVKLKITETVSVYGLVILPDGSTVTASSVTTTTAVASSGAVFLPAAGYRTGTDVKSVGSYGYYWSSTPDGSNKANDVYFRSTAVNTSSSSRSMGYAVRLVR